MALCVPFVGASADSVDTTFPTVSGDFDGDGKTDIAQFSNTASNNLFLNVLLSDGEKFKKSEWWSANSGWNINSIKNRIVSGDFNGDGKDDICAFYDYGKGETRAFVWQSNGNGFSLNWNFWRQSSGFYANKLDNRIVSGDFNGDGKDDVCAFYDYGKGETRAFVWQSQGSQFKLDWNYWYMKTGFSANLITYSVTSGDFDGDGKDDVCAFYDYGKGEARAFVWQSQGSRFKLEWNYWYMKSGFSVSRILKRITSGDYNNDGKTDICAFYDYGKGETRAFIWQSNESYFKLEWNYFYISSGFSMASTDGRIVSGDFNGDGFDDVCGYYIYPDNMGRAFVWRTQGNSFKLDWNWYLTQSFKIVFKANGGSGTMADKTCIYGQVNTLPKCSFTRVGYEFAGWYAYRASDDKWYFADKNNAGWYVDGKQPSGYTKWAYPNGCTVSKTSNVDNDCVVMYAQWKYVGWYSEKYGVSSQGRTLEAFVFNSKATKTLFLDFAVHGFEDEYYRDGQVLVNCANKLIEYYKTHSSELGNYRLVIVPCANPDGTFAGSNNYREAPNAFGRCTAQHFDINRDFLNRNAQETRYLQALIKKYDPDVYVNCHGWLDTVLGNKEIGSIFVGTLGLKYTQYGDYGYDKGYAIGWVAYNIGAKSVLLEFPSPYQVDYTKMITCIRKITR